MKIKSIKPHESFQNAIQELSILNSIDKVHDGSIENARD